MQCEDVAELLSDAADGSVMLDRTARRHVDRCLRCQAELVQYRKLLRALHNLRTEVLEPTPGCWPTSSPTSKRPGERRAVRSLVSGRRVAYVGGIAAATAAGAAGAILFASRARKSKVRLAG